MDITKEWKQIEKGVKISLEDWEELKGFINKLVLQNKDLRNSREMWKSRCMELKVKK